jgi:hypothetical protein
LPAIHSQRSLGGYGFSNGIGLNLILSHLEERGPLHGKITIPKFLIYAPFPKLLVLHRKCYSQTMSKKADLPSEFWHTRHTCGHAVYWSDPAVALQTSAAPCPWCGAAAGRKVPKNVAMLHDPNAGIFAFRQKLPDGRVPWPSELSDASDTIIVRHMADNSCCNN